MFISVYLFSISLFFSLCAFFFFPSNPVRPMSSISPSPRWTTHEPWRSAIFLSFSGHLLCYHPPLDGYLTPSPTFISVFQPVTHTYGSTKSSIGPGMSREALGWAGGLKRAISILLRVKEANVAISDLQEIPERGLKIHFY